MNFSACFSTNTFFGEERTHYEKIFISITASVFFVLTFASTSCGTDEAQIHGIVARVDLPDKTDVCDSTLADKTTLAEKDFIPEVGKTYDFVVDYIAGGGSKYPVLFAENFVLKYNADIFDTEPVSDENCLGEQKPLRYYTLACKQTTS